MTRGEFFEYHDQLTKRMGEITRAKNADYTGAAGDDPFANFNRVDSLGICSTEQGFMVRMLDKYMRIGSFVSLGILKVKDESVEDTILDLANYCLLFLGYLKSKKLENEIVGKPEFFDASIGEPLPGELLVICHACKRSVFRDELRQLDDRGFIFHQKCLDVSKEAKDA